MQPGLLLWVLASSTLLILSFPRPDAGILSLFALVPLFMGLSHVGKRRAFLAGWGAGTAWFFVSYNWLSHSLTTFGNIPLPLAEGAILLMAGIHGLYVGLFSILIPLVAGGRNNGKGVRVYGSKGVVRDSMGVWGYGGMGAGSREFTPLHPNILTPLLVLPSAWVLLEVVRSWFPAPFPWLLMGSAMWKVPFLRPLYGLAGVHGVSFWIVMVNVLIWTVFRVTRERRGRAGILLMVVFLLPLILHPVHKQSTGQRLRVGIVQGNFQQELKWEESLREETLRTYLSLTDRAVQRGAKLVVWPETAVPFFYQAEPELIERLRQFTSDRDIHLIFGSPGYEIAGREILLYNRVYHLSPDGKEEFYDKIMLVPFGEYIPLAGLLPFVDRMVPGEGEFAKGAWKGPFKTPVPSGVLICYEISFPSLSRREVRDGSMMLINVTNDAWFGRSWGPYQHLAVSAVRAMENGVPVLRAANTGISAVIDRSGRIVRSIPLEERGVIVADIDTGGAQTFYTRHGDWIVILSAAVIWGKEINEIGAVDICALAIQMGCNFVARSFSGDTQQVRTLLKAAMSHRGTAVLDIISPCVTFNNHEGSTKSVSYARKHEDPLHDIDYIPHFDPIMVDYKPGTSIQVTMHDGALVTLKKVRHNYDPGNKDLAMSLLHEAQEQLHFYTGLMYYDADSVPFDEEMRLVDEALATLPEERVRPPKEILTEIMASYK